MIEHGMGIKQVNKKFTNGRNKFNHLHKALIDLNFFFGKYQSKIQQQE